MASSLTRRLTADERAPAAARRAVEELEDEIGRELIDVLCLLVTEVVTNSVLHCGRPDGRIGLRVWLEPEMVHVEVHDTGDGFAMPAAPPKPAPGHSGHGLFILHRLSHRWGVERDRGTTVWFELPRAALA